MLMHTLLLAGASRTPESPCFFWADKARGLTYAAAVEQMERMAGALHHHGVRRGDRVTIFAHNGLDYLTAMLGCWRIGAIAALVNVRLADDLEYYLADHQPVAVIYTHDMIEPLRRARATVRSIRTLICMDGPQDGAESLPELMAASLPPPPDPGDETAIAHLSYTSGTTGKPKGACLAHEPTVRASRCIAERLRIGSDDVSFGPSALSSSYQLVANLLPQLSRGAAINVMSRWTADTGYDAIDMRGATMLVANPPILQDLVTASVRRGRLPGRLRLGLSGGGPVSPQLKASFQGELNIPLVESFGQSELGGFVALGLPEIRTDDLETRRVGMPLPDKEVRILDASGREVPTHAVGEIAIRGGYMSGYWNRPEQTERALRDGWLWTGDIGMMDEDGYVTVRGRRSELITVGAEEWYPRDVEEALCAHDGIRGAAVVGVPHPELVNRPVAFVEAVGTIDPDALKASLARKVLHDLSHLEIRAIDVMPMTPTGKIAKAELAAVARSGT